MHEHMVVDADHFQHLLDALAQRGYQVVGPTVRDGAIIYDAIDSVADLPAGWTDEHDGGRYQLKKRDDQALFGYVVGPHSWKRFLYPPTLRLWQIQRQDNGLQFVDAAPEVPKYAFLGVRSCELHAMAIQDRVFMQGPHTRRDIRQPPPGMHDNRRQLRTSGRHVLLRLDANRPQGHWRL